MPDTRFVIALLTKGDNDFNREEKGNKVILVTADGSQYVSNEITTTRYSAECIYDLATGELSEDLEAYSEHDKQEYIGMAKIYLAGTIHYIVKEILIILVECLLYAFFMKQKNGKKLRIILYAVVANLVSMVTSLYVGGPLETRVLFWGFMIIAYIVVLIVFLRNEKRKERG